MISEATRLKLRESHLGQIAWNKGRTVPQITGPKHCHWKGGLPKCPACGAQLGSYSSKRCRSCASKVHRKGKRPSDETMRLAREARARLPHPSLGKKRPDVSGPNCHLWRGGLTSEADRIRKSVEYKSWRRSVFKRDDFTCQECGVRGTKIHADHIFPFAKYPTMRLMVENGRALCVPCHKKTDSYLTKMLTAPLTVRAMIRAIQREVGDDQIDLTPDRASELQIRLSALLGNVMEEGRKAEMDYKRVLLASLKSSEKANRARIEAETTPEYEHYQECRHAKDLTMELLRSLRQFLRTQSEVMRLER